MSGAGLRLTATRLRAGVWEGVLTGAGDSAPAVEVVHDGRPVPGVALSPLSGEPGRYTLRVPVPSEAVSDGLHTVIVRGVEAGDTLAQLALIAGTPVEDDLRAEVALLRAELDLLKRAFRRHCAETEG